MSYPTDHPCVAFKQRKIQVQCIGQEGLILTQPARKCEKDLSEGFLASNGDPAAISFN
jgi:phage terminase large subunit-like protein